MRSGKLTLATLLLLGGTAAQAQVVLTPAGSALFTLSNFATGFPTNGSSTGNIGPLGIAFNGSQVVVSDYPGNVRVFATDADNQTAASAPVGQNYGFANAVGLASTGGNFYMTRQSAGDLVQINANGTFNQVIVGGMSAATGIIRNPNNGHLFVGAFSNNTIYDVDPIAKTKTSFVNAAADGLSTDGVTLFAEVNNHILGYSLATGIQTFDSGFIPGGPDGAAAGFGAALSGNIFVNTNSGTVIEVNELTLVQTVIASGGSRGDFVTVDPNGSLLLTQSDSIQRLTPRQGSFNVPEPGSVALLVGMGVSGAGFLVRRRKSAMKAA